MKNNGSNKVLIWILAICFAASLCGNVGLSNSKDRLTTQYNELYTKYQDLKTKYKDLSSENDANVSLYNDKSDEYLPRQNLQVHHLAVHPTHHQTTTHQRLPM